MKIVFSSSNSTNEKYLSEVGKDNEVYAFFDIKAPEHKIQRVTLVKVYFLFYYLRYAINKLRISSVVPEYIINFNNAYKKLNKVDVIVAFDFNNFTFFQFLKKKKIDTRTKFFVWTETRDWPDSKFRRFVFCFFWRKFKKNSKFVDKIFVFTEEGKAFFNKHVPEAQVHVLPAPIDSSIFYCDVNKQYLPQSTLRIIMNARYIPLKEHRTFFEALEALNSKDVKFRVSLIGRGGGEQEELMLYASQLKISDFITWLDPVPVEELQAVYSAHDVSVLASSREAIGMVVPESMACGVPTVTSNAVGANTYVTDKKTGFIFEVGNVSQLVEYLILMSKQGVAEKMGKAAALKITNNYQTETLAEKFSSLMQ